MGPASDNRYCSVVLRLEKGLDAYGGVKTKAFSQPEPLRVTRQTPAWGEGVDPPKVDRYASTSALSMPSLRNMTPIGPP